MISWIIIIALIVLAYLCLKVYHFKHRIFFVFVILALLFFYATASKIATKYEINWKSFSGIEEGMKIYFAWLGGAFNNLRSITANAIKMDWTMENRTSEVVKIAEKK